LRAAVLITSRETCALLSVLLHAALLLTLNVALPDPPKAPKPPVEADLISGSPELLPKMERVLDPSALHIDCPATYEGIGIKRAWGGMVTEVAKGWPADRAGIVPGDLVLPWGIDPYEGFMEFEVHRGGKVVKMRLRTEKICFRDKPF